MPNLCIGFLQRETPPLHLSGMWGNLVPEQ